MIKNSDLVLCEQHGIILTNIDHDLWRHITSLRLNELIKLAHVLPCI